MEEKKYSHHSLHLTENGNLLLINKVSNAKWPTMLSLNHY